MKRFIAISLFVLIAGTAKAQSWQDTIKIIDGFFSRYKPGNPGCQLSISRNGKMIYSKAFGSADIERSVPYTTETVTEAGSITKQFTAAAILLLEQQGKLSLEDDVHKYLPEFPDYGSLIKLKHLMHHTSGIREWSDLEAITGWPRTTKAYTNEDVFKMLCRQRKLNNTPGSEYIYSNSNYLLLTLIIERVSGMKLADFTAEYIFKPAGMVHTCWRDNFKKIIPNRGIAYLKRGDHYEINMPNENVYGPGALLTTAEDLLKWTNFFFANRLGNPGLLKKQLALEPITGGADAYYAAGLFIGKFKGYDIISHTGQTAGYVGVVETLPELQLSVTWLSNTTEFRDSLYVGITAIDNLFVKDQTPAALPENNKTTSFRTKQTGKYAGWYSDIRNDRGAEITLEHDTLLLNKTPLLPVKEKEFRYKESSIKFNNVGGFILTTSDNQKISFKKQVPAKMTASYLKSFAGTYYSKETESSFKILLKDGKLIFEANYLKDVALTPSYKNAFNFDLNLDSDMWPVPGNILFESNDSTQLNTCSVSMNDARKIKFIRTK